MEPIKIVEHETVEEPLALREQCVYELRPEEPDCRCRYWAIRTVPTEFPDGAYVERTEADGPVELVAIVCAERNAVSKWKWVGLTPAARRVFGKLLFAYAKDHSQWHYVLEYDARREETEEQPSSAEREKT